MPAGLEELHERSRPVLAHRWSGALLNLPSRNRFVKPVMFMNVFRTPTSNSVPALVYWSRYACGNNNERNLDEDQICSREVTHRRRPITVACGLEVAGHAKTPAKST